MGQDDQINDNSPRMVWDPDRGQYRPAPRERIPYYRRTAQNRMLYATPMPGFQNYLNQFNTPMASSNFLVYASVEDDRPIGVRRYLYQPQGVTNVVSLLLGLPFPLSEAGSTKKVGT